MPGFDWSRLDLRRGSRACPNAGRQLLAMKWRRCRRRRNSPDVLNATRDGAHRRSRRRHIAAFVRGEYDRWKSAIKASGVRRITRDSTRATNRDASDPRTIAGWLPVTTTAVTRSSKATAPAPISRFAKVPASSATCSGSPTRRRPRSTSRQEPGRAHHRGAPPRQRIDSAVDDFPPVTRTAQDGPGRAAAGDGGPDQHSQAARRAGTPTCTGPRASTTASSCQGEIDMLLDEPEVDLKAGDIIVQQATNHAWVNRSRRGLPDRLHPDRRPRSTRHNADAQKKRNRRSAHEIRESSIPSIAAIRASPIATRAGWSSAGSYDRSGFYAYHIAERHSTPLGIAGAPEHMLSAVAQRTKRLRFGPLVYTLTAKQSAARSRKICMLDQMSRGRLGSRRRPRQLALRDRLFRSGRAKIGHDLHRRLPGHSAGPAIAGDRFRGQHYQLKNVPVELECVPKPHPPIWYGLSRAAAVPWAARTVSTSSATRRRRVSEPITDRYRRNRGPDAHRGARTHAADGARAPYRGRRDRAREAFGCGKRGFDVGMGA